MNPVEDVLEKGSLHKGCNIGSIFVSKSTKYAASANGRKTMIFTRHADRRNSMSILIRGRMRGKGIYATPQLTLDLKETEFFPLEIRAH